MKTSKCSSLKYKYDNIIHNPKLWDYYNIDDENSEKFTIDDISNPEKCYIFITKYIAYSQKDNVIFLKYINLLLEDKEDCRFRGYRLCHIVSTFFLGLALFENEYIKKNICRELKKIKVFDTKDILEKEFIFVWFMICMFHDLGYVFERNLNSDEISLDNLNDEKQTLMSFLKEMKEKNGTPSYYNDILENYYKYREGKDHGILGGLSYAKYVLEIRNKKSRDTSLDANEKEKWNKKLTKLYKYVGWCICCHNIWYVRFADSSCKAIMKYINNDLYPLILNNRKDKGKYIDYPIIFQNHPLFFFFCLIDTLEPIKICNSIFDVHHVLSEISFDMSKNEAIHISSQNQSYSRVLLGLNEWLINIEKIDNINYSFKLK